MKRAICRFARVLLAVAVTFAMAAGNEVRAEVSRFAIPSVSTTRNDGSSFGLIVPNLVTDQDKELRYLVTPLFVVNTIVGAQGALNVFRYDTGGRRCGSLPRTARRSNGS